MFSPRRELIDVHNVLLNIDDCPILLIYFKEGERLFRKKPMAEVRQSAVIVPRQTGAALYVANPPPRIISPWADLPKELQGGFKTINTEDFSEKKPYDPNASLHLTSSELKQRWIQELRRRKEVEDEKMYSSRRADSRMLDELLEKRFSPSEYSTTFDHRGVTTRAASAPIEEFMSKLDQISEREKVRREKVPAPVVHSITPTPQLEREFAGLTFWYPADKQKLRYRLMEEARLAAARMDLTDRGWAPDCTPGGAPKRLGKIGPKLSPEEERQMEEEWKAFLEAQVSREAEQKAHEASLQEEADLSEEEVSRLMRVNGVPPEVAVSDSIVDAEAALTASLLLEKATSSFKPPQIFRAELPSSRLPIKLDFPRAKQVYSTPAPPWGRQTEEEERWKKRAQQALADLRLQEEDAVRGGSSFAQPTPQRSLLRPVTKSDIDRELKVVRDGGLQRRPKQSVVKSMGVETLAFVKSLPKDFGKKAAGPRLMQPVPAPGAASLKM